MKIQQSHMKTLGDEVYNLDRILHNLSRKQLPYFSCRALKYSPHCPFLRKQVHSVQKVQSQYQLNRQLLFGQQLTYIKTMMMQNLISASPANKALSTEDSTKIQALTSLAKKSLKNLQLSCKYHVWRGKKRENNLSEPKYKQTTIRIKKNIPNPRPSSIDQGQQHSFFLKSYLDLENKIIIWKDILIMDRRLVKHYQNTNESQFCLQFSEDIIENINQIQKIAELDIFQREIIINDLKKAHQNFRIQERVLSNTLFQDVFCNIGLSQQEIRRKRLTRLQKLAKSMNIQVNAHNKLDFDKILNNFKAIKHLYLNNYDEETLKILTRVKKLQRIASSSENSYLVQYYIGLRRFMPLEEFQLTHIKKCSYWKVREL